MVAKAALLDHCNVVYAKMEESAQGEDYEGYNGLVYRGHLTRMFNDLGLAVPYYTSVMRRLQDMDCVKQLRRGGGNAMSIWALLRTPTEELFNIAEEAVPRVSSTRKTPVSEVLQQQIRDLASRVNSLEQDVELLKALAISGGQEHDVA